MEYEKNESNFLFKAGPLTVIGRRYDGISYISFRVGKISLFLTNKWYVFKRRTFVYHWNRFKTAIIPWPIYYINDSGDCDHVRVVSAWKAKNGWHYLKDCDAIYEGAEGPEGIWRVTKAEYENHETTRRDYMAEAFEDGHPHSPDY